MANVMTALKDEITRLSRKEAKAAMVPLHKPAMAARKSLADLKRRVEALESEIVRLQRASTDVAPTAAKQKQTATKAAPKATAKKATTTPKVETKETAVGTEPKVRITAKTIKALRKKLQLPVTQFAKLVGVTPKWVYMWELKEGPLRMRAATLDSLLAVREMGVREAAQRLAELTPDK